LTTNARVEFIHLRARDSNGLQNADVAGWGDKVAVNKTISGTALTGAGRVLCPTTVNGAIKFHARINCTVESIWTRAPAGDAGTSYDAAVGIAGAISIPANTPTLLPVSSAELLSGATGLTFA
jgi:hypothetical protein